MKNTKFLALALAAALAASILTGCGSAASSTPASSAPASVAASSEAASEPAASEAAQAAAIQATFTVTGPDETSTEYTLDAVEGETLADALLAAGLISEEEAAAGFVTTVNGVTADWDADQAWWCLVDGAGEMTAVGISDIQLADGDSYAFIYTAG